MKPDKRGVSTEEATPGWVGTFHRGDGSSIAYWAPTEREARKKAQQH